MLKKTFKRAKDINLYLTNGLISLYNRLIIDEKYPDVLSD